MRLLITTIAFLAVLGLSLHAQDLPTVYTVSGINPGNSKEYQGVMELTKLDQVYRLKWTLGKHDGEWIEAYGHAILVGGKYLNVVILAGDGSLTTALYNLKDGVFEGVWSIAGTDLISYETLTPSKEDAEALKKKLPVAGGVAL